MAPSLVMTARWSVKGSRGSMHVWWTNRGVCAVTFPTPRAGVTLPLRKRERGAVSVSRASFPAAWRRSLEGLLTGHPIRKSLPVDLRFGTSFEQSVWRATQKIPAGSVKCYQEIARTIGKPGAMQAVGQALKRNPVPLLVPCHRVVQASRNLGGFSGGRGWKERLLTAEGCNISRGKILS